MRPLIFSADDHLTHRRPQYRTDDYAAAMLRKLEFKFQTARERGASVLFAGDLFDRPSGPYWFLNAVLGMFNRSQVECYAVVGNHDMSFYNPEIAKSQFGTLVEAGALELLQGCREIGGALVCGRSWGEKYPELTLGPAGEEVVKILVAHETVTKGDPPPWLTGYSAEQMIENNPGFDYIITGDFHEKFMVIHEGTTLVNTGPLSRASIDKRDFRPAIWCISDSGVEEIPVPIEPGVFDLRAMEDRRDEEAEGARFNSELINNFILSLTDSDRNRPNFRQMVSTSLQGVKDSELRTIIEEIMDETGD